MIKKLQEASWLYIFTIVFLVNFNALFITRIITNQPLDILYLFWYFIISLLISFVISLGVFGITHFSVIVMFFNLVAIMNMIYISISKMQGEWTGIVGFINYLTFLLLGIIAGIGVQLVYNVKEKEEKKLKNTYTIYYGLSNSEIKKDKLVCPRNPKYDGKGVNTSLRGLIKFINDNGMDNTIKHYITLNSDDFNILEHVDFDKEYDMILLDTPFTIDLRNKSKIKKIKNKK